MWFWHEYTNKWEEIQRPEINSSKYKNLVHYKVNISYQQYKDKWSAQIGSHLEKIKFDLHITYYIQRYKFKKQIHEDPENKIDTLFYNSELLSGLKI